MNSENRKFLGRKTQRNNFSKNKPIDKPKTTIKLISLFNKRYKSNDYVYINFSDCVIKRLDRLIEKNAQTIKLKIKSNKIYEICKIELINRNGNKNQCFYLPIYINKINTFYINLRPKKKSYCFEYIFYRKNNLNMSVNLLYKNEITIDKFDDYNLKYRKKIIAINVEKSLANKYIKKKLSLDYNSYKICVRVNDDGKEISSVHEIQLEENAILDSFALIANKNDIEKIDKLYKEFKVKKSLEFIQKNKKYKKLIEDNTHAFYKFIKNYDYTNKSYLEISKITDNDVIILKEYLLKFVLKFFSIDINNKAKSELSQINKMLLIAINNINNIIYNIDNFTKKFKNSTELKFRLYRSTLYNLYSITKKKSSNKEACLAILSEYNQKILDIKSTSKDNPYYKAIAFLKNIANNLKEDSCLFDLLMQYNSGISNDINLFRKKKKIIENEDTQFELSMLTVEEITNHLKDILPTFLIRYTCNSDVYAFHSSLNDLIFINERKTFESRTIVDFDKKSEFTLPIVIILLHECWGHRKIYLSNKIKKETPIRYRLRSKNFDEDINMILTEKTDEIKGESGLGIEYLISGSKKNNNFIFEYILNHAEDTKDLLNVKLWVQSNFDELQIKIWEKLIKLSETDKNFNLSKYREENKNTSIYGLGVYYEDDVKIGPLFKV